jgi:signal transduction histidine kinase
VESATSGGPPGFRLLARRNLFPSLALLALGALVFWRIYEVRHDPSRAATPFRIGYEHSWPYQEIGKNGEPIGPVVEIIEEACRRGNIPLQWVPSTEGPEASLTSGRVDLWPVLNDLPERHKIFYITEPWLTNSFWMVARKSTHIMTPGDATGKTVIYHSDMMGRRLVQKFFPRSDLIAVPTNAAVLRGVVEGRADIGQIGASQAQASELAQAAESHGIDLRFYPLYYGYGTMGTAASFHRPDARWAADKIRREIGEMALDGTIAGINLRWFLDPSSETLAIFSLAEARRENVYLTVVVGFLMIVLVALGWLIARLHAAQRAADAANIAKGQFLANMSHEIRTPLNGVLGMTQLALATELNLEQRELLLTSYESANTLLTVVNDILDFSKIDAGKLELESVPVNLPELIDSIRRSFAVQAQQKKLTFTVEIAPDCPGAIQGDPTRLRQVLFNLLGNALKFTQEGGITLRVRKVPNGSHPSLEFSVADTGIGIPADKIKLMFRPFSQADASTTRRFGGTGLGLSITQRLVKLMGGTIWLESKSPGGTTFFFTIPLTAVDLGPSTSRELQEA